MRIDNLQYANWSEAIFRQMHEGGVHAVHATVAYHENFRETVAVIERWNRRFERFPELIFPGRSASDVDAAVASGRTAIFFGAQNPEPHRGRHRARGDPARARRALHAAELQQPVPAGHRLLRGGGSGHHAHGPRGDRRDEPRRHGGGHEPLERSLDDRGRRALDAAHRHHARQPPRLGAGTAQQERTRHRGGDGQRRHARLLALPAPPEGRLGLHARELLHHDRAHGRALTAPSVSGWARTCARTSPTRSWNGCAPGAGPRPSTTAKARRTRRASRPCRTGSRTTGTSAASRTGLRAVGMDDERGRRHHGRQLVPLLRRGLHRPGRAETSRERDRSRAGRRGAARRQAHAASTPRCRCAIPPP